MDSKTTWEIGDGYIIEDGVRYVRCKPCNGSGKVEDCLRPSDPSVANSGDEERLVKDARNLIWDCGDSFVHDLADRMENLIRAHLSKAVPDSGDVEGLLEDLINDVRGAGTRQTAHELRNWIRAFGERVEKARAHFAAKTKH